MLHETATWEFKPESSGNLTCHATNTVGSSEKTVTIEVLDEAVFMEPGPEHIYRGDNVTIICYALDELFEGDIEIKINGSSLASCKCTMLIISVSLKMRNSS